MSTACQSQPRRMEARMRLQEQDLLSRLRRVLLKYNTDSTQPTTKMYHTSSQQQSQPLYIRTYPKLLHPPCLYTAKGERFCPIPPAKLQPTMARSSAKMHQPEQKRQYAHRLQAQRFQLLARALYSSPKSSLDEGYRKNQIENSLRQNVYM